MGIDPVVDFSGEWALPALGYTQPLQHFHSHLVMFDVSIQSLPQMKSLDHCEAGGVTSSPPLQSVLCVLFERERKVAKFQGCREPHNEFLQHRNGTCLFCEHSRSIGANGYEHDEPGTF